MSHHEEYEKVLTKSKEQYYSNMVDDLKKSNPRQRYAKVKRMGGLENKKEELHVEELEDDSVTKQVKKLADFYSETRNSFDPIDPKEFSEYFHSDDVADILVDPQMIEKTISGMNKRSSSVPGDIPMKLVVD